MRQKHLRPKITVLVRPSLPSVFGRTQGVEAMDENNTRDIPCYIADLRMESKSAYSTFASGDSPCSGNN
jgi:hypothetical protein